MGDYLNGESYFGKARHEFLSKYQTKTDPITNLQPNKKAGTTGGSSVSFGRDIPIEDDEISK